MKPLKTIPTWKSSLTLLGMISAFMFCFGGQAHAQCASPANAIVAENCLPGNPSSEWDLGAGSTGDLSIQGFATDISFNQGDKVNFKISTPASAYTILIYRIGYYGGNGARKIATITPSAQLPQTQPACASDKTTGLVDCGNWAVSASWQVPATATSGVYFAHLIRSDTGGDSHVVFIVRNDASHSAIMYQTADETWQAYNYYGGGSLYGQNKPAFDLTDRSYKVSYNRPFLTRGFAQEWDTWIFGAEFAMIQWLESNGYDVTYFTGIDAARSGSLIKNHKVYMDSGHDEYWSGPQRTNVQAARDAGVNLAFFSGNTMFWKTRWENSIDGANTPNRTLVCYKETLAFAKLDPQDPPVWTGTFRDPSFSPPADGGNPENSLVGSLFMVNGTGDDNDGSLRIKVPAADGKMRFWRNTAVATQSDGATYSLPAATLGYEWDLDVDNGSRPAGAFQLSTATYNLTSDYLLDYGATYGAGTATHHLMMYRAPSGALVFSSASIDWSWGLNSNHDNLFGFATPNPDKNMQQATVNLFADMGVQATTPQAGIVPASASSDTVPPTSTITYPTAGSTINTGSTVTVTGVANDSGGVVAGVEFSSDGGSTWHPATGRSSWTYTWTPSAVNSSTNLLSRAVDDSANLETPGTGVTVNVLAQVCPCTIWSSSKAPATPDSGDASAVELGVKFRADSNGSVIGVRFYKSAKNTGTHIGHIWTSSGTLLGTATFTGESSSGWQQVSFSSPIQVVANTTYVVSYFAPSGHYAADSYAFAEAGVDNPPLHALANGVDGGNGVFLYPPSNTPGGFPSSSNLSANYWVDVVYTSSNTYGISGSISGPGGGGATVNLTGPETSTTTADASGNFSFNGVVNGTYTVTPSNAGVSFTPASSSVTVNGGVVSGVNFTAVVTNPLTVSGNISGGSGAAVTLSGASSATTTADASGNFSFGGLLSGSYTVTPSEPGFIFTPGTQTVALSGSSASGVNFQGQLCNCVSIWQPSTTPALIDSNDGTPVELGVKFRTDSPGSLTALRFYKAATNVGTHVAHLWTSTGTLIGTATFTSESASGWQQVNFSSPITLAANTTYIASYYAPSGHYSADTNYFATKGADNAPLHALANGVDGANGVYLYTSSQSGGFPTNTYSSTNYWVDVLFAGSQGYSISGNTTGAPGATVALSGTGTTTADSSGNYSFNGIFPGAYSVTPSLAHFTFIPGSQNVSISSANVTGINFTVPAICPCDTIWAPVIVPATIDSGDALPYELGVKFKADSDGYILGVRFYKAASNTGTHVAHLWAPTGNLNPLSSATFSSETASGWQQVMFANPVPVSGNSTYIASYFAPVGHYSVNKSYFTSGGVDQAPLHALATGVSGPNGVYTQASTSVLPASSFQDSNYWVDVIYASTSTHSLGGVISGPGAAGAALALSGASTATITSDAFGNFSFSGLADGTYTVTPSQSGYLFSPTSQTVTISGAHNLGVNFNSAVPTYTISGAVSGAPGITVALSGAATASVTADASGNYSFSSLAVGTYTVTPSNVGYAVTPSSQNVTISNASVSAVNFSATATAFAISGTITGGAGATVILNGVAHLTTTADSSGNYSFPGVTGGSYTVTPALAGLVFVPTNLAAPVSGANVSGVNFAIPQGCPCDTLWQPASAPAVVDAGDHSSVEVGVKFQSDTAGVITGIRFYKSAANTGVHIGNLWSSTGTLLATATFVSESSSGWQQVFFATPVAITASTVYVASYFAPAGHYAGDSGFFASAGVDAPPLHALANGVSGTNGVYTYGSASAFPTSSYNSANYWVDAIYEPSFTVSGTITGAVGSGTTVTLAGPFSLTATADASGNYNFPAVTSGTYTATPASATASFTPSSQNVVVNGANVAIASFSATPNSYSITGTISGTGGAGATVTLSGAASQTVTASTAGVYTFPNLANGSYTVTPTNSGFTFTPPSQAVTVNGANATANFGSAALFTISGTISGAGGAGASVVLSGASSATVTANSSGVYTFPLVPNGSYTVTPNNNGFVFTPPNQAVTVSGANATVNFSSAAPTYVISGTITGTGGSGATVTLSGAASATVTANTSGVYTFPAVPNGSYTVTPAHTGFIFTPASQAVTVSGASKAANFTAIAVYTISGTLSGAGASGATVNLTGSATGSVTTTSTGTYTFTVPNGSYTVTPTKTGYSFTPANQAVTVSGANKTANFNSVAVYTISGTISGPGASGATVTLTGSATATVTANTSGVYTFAPVPNGSYTITPTKAGFGYTPASQAVTVSGANKTANFSSVVTYTISGTISGSAGSGATVKLTGAATATVTSNSSGAYSFTGLANGSYTVTPSKFGHFYSPSQQAVTVSSANKTANFSTIF